MLKKDSFGKSYRIIMELIKQIIIYVCIYRSVEYDGK